MEACGYGKKAFISLKTPVWAGLSAESRLSDVVVFSNDPPRGRGPLAEAFQQIIVDEQRPVVVARDGLYLPSGLALTPEQLNEVCDALEALGPGAAA